MILRDDLCSHCLLKGKKVKADIIQYPIKLCNKCYNKLEG